jgi:hypothetical protein
MFLPRYIPKIICQLWRNLLNVASRRASQRSGSDIQRKVNWIPHCAYPHLPPSAPTFVGGPAPAVSFWVQHLQGGMWAFGIGGVPLLKGARVETANVWQWFHHVSWLARPNKKKKSNSPYILNEKVSSKDWIASCSKLLVSSQKLKMRNKRRSV